MEYAARYFSISLVILGIVISLMLAYNSGKKLQSPLSFPDELRPAPSLHADESVQWSCAKESASGIHYSQHQDKFHGPALAVMTQIVFTLRQLEFDDAMESDLRAVPFSFFLLICFVPLALQTVALRLRIYVSLMLLLGASGCYFGHYFIQEVLLVAGFIVGLLFYMKSIDLKHPKVLLIFSGAGFGLSLACKVTAVAYLGILFISFAIFARELLTWSRIKWVSLGCITAWLCLQTSLFNDWSGLFAWGHQFQRSFIVAAGNQDTLPLTNPGYWFTVGGWLFALLGLRLCYKGRRSAEDIPLAISVGCYLFHLLLPYKTPWLLLLPVCLSLSMAWPLLVKDFTIDVRGVLGLLIATIFIVESASVIERHTPTILDGNSLEKNIGAYRQTWQRMYPEKQFYVSVVEGHIWPLPYYLRRFPVGYGTFKGAESAPIRFVIATDDSVPMVYGYQAHKVTLRPQEDYWMLVENTLGDNNFTFPIR